MPRQYSNGGRVAREPAGRAPGGTSPANNRSLRERVGALRHLWPFLAMVWRTSPQLTAASLVLRLLRALLPVVALYVGKLIIDDVVLLVQAPDKPESKRGKSRGAVRFYDSLEGASQIHSGNGAAVRPR
jgi:ATP-binding cassette, subfamily B, bacterial